MVGKDEESVIIVTEGLHVIGAISLKRFNIDKAVLWPLVYRGLDRITRLGVEMVGKSNEIFIIYYKRRASVSSPGSYLLKFFKLVSVPFVYDRVYAEGGVIIKISNGEKQFRKYFKEVKTGCSKCWNVLK